MGSHSPLKVEDTQRMISPSRTRSRHLSRLNALETSNVVDPIDIVVMDGPKPQIRESVFGTFFRFLGVLLLRGGANAERRFGFEPLDLMPSVWQRG